MVNIMIKKTTFFKFVILVILTVVTIFVLKFNSEFKINFYKYVYEDSISFAKINNWYKSKFGSSLPFSDYFEEVTPVFNEQLKYNSSSIYKDGVSLEVGYDYLVPALDSGIVIFIGEKEGYGKTVIIQQENGIDVWYSNLKEINLQLYDYIKDGSLIGSVDENLYLVFIKNGEVLDYQEYI